MQVRSIEVNGEWVLHSAYPRKSRMPGRSRVRLSSAASVVGWALEMTKRPVVVGLLLVMMIAVVVAAVAVGSAP